MKRIKTAVLGLLLVAGVAQANWVHLHTNKKGDVVFEAPRRIFILLKKRRK